VKESGVMYPRACFCRRSSPIALAAFKPDSKRGRGRWKGEVAAFQLARALDIDNVPRSIEERFSFDELVRAAADDEKAKALLEGEVITDGGAVTGAYIPWIDDYAVLPLENDKAGRGWLKKDGALPDEKKDLARAISTMIVFDYVTGNWDRWSGANIATSKGKLLYVDNDGAFFESPPKDFLARNKRTLEGVDRFSRSFVAKLRGLGDEQIAKTLELLSKKAIDGVLARRKEALAIVDTKELFFD